MKRFLIAVMLALASLSLGCAGSPSQQWRTSARIYQTTVATATDLANLNLLPLSDAEKFEAYRAPAWTALSEAAAQILLGDPTATKSSLETARERVRFLRELLLQYQEINRLENPQ